MFKALITEFPLSDVPKERTITEEKIRKYTYTKEEVDVLISAAVKEAVEEAKRIDEESMAKHNRDATVISMILGFTTLALFVDGLLRMLGIIPPFMDLDERYSNLYIPCILRDTICINLCVYVENDVIYIKRNG